jgi:hypothetical protein
MAVQAAFSAARRFRHGLGLIPLALTLAAAFASTAQAAPVGLGTAETFGVLGGSTVTNTGPTTITGDLGVSPGSAVTGFPPGTISGAMHVNDAVAGQAQSDLVTAYNDAAGRSSTATVSGDLAGRTLVAGVYTSASSLGLSGDLTLDAKGDPNAVFVFQAGSDLTTGSGSHVLLTGGAQACNVFWQVGSSATIGTSTAFAGNILALTSISLTTGATLDGRALARNGAVTLDTNSVTRARCATNGSGSGGSGGSGGGGAGGSTTTTGVAPRVITGRATHVCPASTGPLHSQLAGRVRPGAAGSRYYFQYGTTKHYGRRTASGHLAAGVKLVTVRRQARNLRAGTKYHYRVVSVGLGGRKTVGADRSFRTLDRDACRTNPARPPVTTRGFTG